jgi:hypothetical protein
MTTVVAVGKETDVGRLPITGHKGDFHSPEIQKMFRNARKFRTLNPIPSDRFSINSETLNVDL